MKNIYFILRRLVACINLHAVNEKIGDFKFSVDINGISKILPNCILQSEMRESQFLFEQFDTPRSVICWKLKCLYHFENVPFSIQIYN